MKNAPANNQTYATASQGLECGVRSAKKTLNEIGTLLN